MQKRGFKGSLDRLSPISLLSKCTLITTNITKSGQIISSEIITLKACYYCKSVDIAMVAMFSVPIFFCGQVISKKNTLFFSIVMWRRGEGVISTSIMRTPESAGGRRIYYKNDMNATRPLLALSRSLLSASNSMRRKGRWKMNGIARGNSRSTCSSQLHRTVLAAVWINVLMPVSMAPTMLLQALEINRSKDQNKLCEIGQKKEEGNQRLPLLFLVLLEKKPNLS